MLGDNCLMTGTTCSLPFANGATATWPGLTGSLSCAGSDGIRELTTLCRNSPAGFALGD